MRMLLYPRGTIKFKPMHMRVTKSSKILKVLIPNINMKKTIFSIILFIFLITFLNSSEFGNSFKLNECANLLQTCDNCTYVNISSITYPNSTKTILNNAMEQHGLEYNYTFCNTTVLGLYYYTVIGDKNGEQSVETISFEITPNGNKFDTGQSIGGLGVFIGVLAISFAFLFIGSKLSQEEKTLPFGFFFMVMAIILVIFSLHLGWIFSIDILQHEIISESLSTIFVVILWSSTGIAIIFFCLMLIAFIKELGRIADKKRFGNDFNPLTSSYE